MRHKIPFLTFLFFQLTTVVCLAQMGPGSGPGGMHMFPGMHPPGFHGPGTFDMAGMQSEMMRFLTATSTSGTVVQRSDGSLLITPVPGGDTHSFLVPPEGFTNVPAPGWLGPSMALNQAGTLDISTSAGYFTGQPFAYDLDGMMTILNDVSGGQTQVTFEPDGTFFMQFLGIGDQICLRAEALATPGGTQSADGSLQAVTDIFGPAVFNYANGFMQTFNPSFAFQEEIRSQLTCSGVDNVAPGADGSLTANLGSGQSAQLLTLRPSMILESGPSAFEAGFHHETDGSWWFGYMTGERQFFRPFLDGTPF